MDRQGPEDPLRRCLTSLYSPCFQLTFSNLPSISKNHLPSKSQQSKTLPCTCHIKPGVLLGAFPARATQDHSCGDEGLVTQRMPGAPSSCSAPSPTAWLARGLTVPPAALLCRRLRSRAGPASASAAAQAPRRAAQSPAGQSRAEPRRPEPCRAVPSRAEPN